jgi:hypothetical protein
MQDKNGIIFTKDDAPDSLYGVVQLVQSVKV